MPETLGGPASVSKENLAEQQIHTGVMTMDNKQNPIPLIIIEEHHQAFTVWQEASGRGIIPPAGNALLHTDTHDDLVQGGIPTSIHALPEDSQGIADYTYQNLGIANFIIPQLYQGLLGEVAWLKGFGIGNASDTWRSVVSWKSEGRHFTSGEVTPMLRRVLENPENKWGNHSFYRYIQLQSTNDYQTHRPLILDFDLDIFSCDNGLSSAETRIEITAEAYREYQENPYHPMRLLPAAALSAHREGEGDHSRYYLTYEEFQEIPELLKVSESVIERRIGKLKDFLSRNQLKPVLITLCRSRMSGYTPEDQWRQIETKLLKALREIYSMKVIPLHLFLASGEGYLQTRQQPGEK